MLRKISLAIYYGITVFMLMACNSSSETSKTSNPLIKNTKSSTFHQNIVANTLAINSDGKYLSAHDLANFAQSLGSARIVGLGEQSHGAGSVFTLKTQLIKYLHEHHDFDVFILESGMFDVQEIWQQAQAGVRIKDIAPDNIFYMYAKTDEVTPLFDYINDQITSNDPLILVGFDSQHTGGISNKSLVPALTKALNKSSANKGQLVKWPLLSAQIQHVLDISNSRYSIEIERMFFQQLDQLQEIFLADTEKNIAGSDFWYRITKGLEAQAKRQWKIADNRSKEMGENIKYWAKKYPDKKILVWAHTWHLTRDGGYQVNAGQVVANAFGKQYFIAHFTGASGEYLDFVTMQNKKIIVPSKNSLEAILDRELSADIGFLNVRSLSKNIEQNIEQSIELPMLVFSNDYQQTLPADQWSRFFDGIFFIKNIKPAKFEE